MFELSTISQHWDGVGTSNPSLWRTRKGLLILYSQYDGFWRSGNARNQGISNHGIDLVIPV